MGIKLAAAFGLVALVSVAAAGIATRMALQTEFRGYLYDVWISRRPAAPGEAGEPSAPPGGARQAPGGSPETDDEHALFMRRMMGPRWAAVMRFMVGLPERRFLARVDSMLWRAGVVAVALGALAGAALAQGWSRRLNRLAGRALERAKQERFVAPPGGDEIDQLDAAFSTMEKALDEEDRRRRRLLADIAHELKTPLAIVQANLEAMLDGVIPSSPDRLAAVHTQVGLLSRLVTDLRDLAMAEAGQLTLHRTPQNVGELVHRIVEMWEPQAQEKGVRVEVEVTGNPTASVDGDRFAQVLLNLLSNALRYVPAQTGRIRVVVNGERPQVVVIDVEDNGTGIAPEDLPYIFDHFYRGDPARSRATGGFGVGLGIVRSLVEAHGGQVQVENLPGGGARFRVVLPASPGAVAAVRGGVKG